MSPQPCVGQVPIWAFDSSAGLCVPYKVGICQANGNKFYTQAECEEYCGKTEEDGELKKGKKSLVSGLLKCLSLHCRPDLTSFLSFLLFQMQRSCLQIDLKGGLRPALNFSPTTTEKMSL